MGLQLVLTHENTDFDGLASQLAASKLYPEAVPVLSRRMNRNLHEFLIMYGGELPFVGYDDLPRRRPRIESFSWTPRRWSLPPA